MSQKDLRQRTKAFAIETIRLCEALPKNEVCRVIGRQLLRAATSVGANYRAACRAKSRNDFICKMNIVEEEADEAAYWIELLIENGLAASPMAGALLQEANELIAISVASINTARKSVTSK